jgi:hypothetical protein
MRHVAGAIDRSVEPFSHDRLRDSLDQLHESRVLLICLKQAPGAGT